MQTVFCVATNSSVASDVRLGVAASSSCSFPPWGKRLGEGVNAKAVSCNTPSPSLSPKGERSMSETCGKRGVAFAGLLRRHGARQGVDDRGLTRGHLVVDPLVGLL